MKKIFLMFVLMGIMIVSAGILVSAKDEIGIVVNGENDSATEEIYHTISEKMSKIQAD